MKKFIILSSFFILVNNSFAQEDNNEPIPVEKEAPINVHEVHHFVEEQAEYPGGYPALLKYIKSNIVYPKECYDKNIEGRIYIKFVIEKDGLVGEIFIVNKGRTHPELEREAIRIIKALPLKWEPGKSNGTIVRSYITLPINFNID